MRVRKRPNYDAVCFHSQQCVEKYLKAILQENDIAFGKTHNLVILFELLLPLEPSWERMRPQLQILNGYAVEVRYPGESAGPVRRPEAPLWRHRRKLGEEDKKLSRESMRLQEFPGISDPAFASGIIKTLISSTTRPATITTAHEYQ